jgi:uncharacterized protein YjbI with pentapeptide repeats
MTLERTKYLRDLRRGMSEYFELDELQTLAFDLAVDWGELSGSTKSNKSQALIKHLAARGRLGDLLTLLQEERPHIDWPEIPPPEVQIEDEESLVPQTIREGAYRDYMQAMTELLRDGLQKAYYDIPDREVARVRTHAVLRELDSLRKGRVVRFLYESKLLGEGENYTPEAVILLRGADLEGASLGQVKLVGIHLRGANLRLANLSEADLGRAMLDDTELAEADLSAADLSGANLRGANLKGADLSRANLANADLGYADLSGVKLSGADMTGANLEAALVVGADLSLARLDGLDFTKATVEAADMRQASLEGANLRGARLERADLSGANLKSAILAEADLGGANLNQAILEQAELSGTNLDGADLSWANLSFARLEGASLASADLSNISYVHGSFSAVRSMEGAKLSDDRPLQEWLAGRGEP